MLDKIVEIREFSIVVVADNQSPTILNPDFLKYNHIVPAEWELAMPPICTPPISQVVFKNGFNIVAQADKVTFWQPLDAENLLINVPEVSQKYVEALPYISYRAIGINLTGHVVADKEEDTQNFILHNLIAPGNWKNFQGYAPDVLVQFVYRLENGTLMIAVQRGIIQENPENGASHILIFAGNFHRDVSGISNEEKFQYVKEAIQSWETGVNTFKSLVEEIFLSVS